jgi:hypothetical protein
MPAQLKTVAGIKVYPARCDNQQLISSNGSLTQYSADNATQISAKGVVSINQDGSGTSTNERLTLDVQADGSGTWLPKATPMTILASP